MKEVSEKEFWFSEFGKEESESSSEREAIDRDNI